MKNDNLPVSPGCLYERVDNLSSDVKRCVDEGFLRKVFLDSSKDVTLSTFLQCISPLCEHGAAGANDSLEAEPANKYQHLNTLCFHYDAERKIMLLL